MVYSYDRECSGCPNGATSVHLQEQFHLENGVEARSRAYTEVNGNPDYDRSHHYDTLGRPSDAIIKLDATANGRFTTTTTYDLWGRPITLTQQRGTADPKVFDQRYNNRGYLSTVERGSLVLWKATEQDAAGQVTRAELGNGLVQTRTFYPQTGRLDSTDLRSADDLKLSENYTYDVLGNVATREQQWSGTDQFHEVFEYDPLNRLTSSKIGSDTRSFSYDDIGNITTKTGLGAYSYPANHVRPHAVSSIAGLTTLCPGNSTAQEAFQYDAGGNLLCGAGHTATWTSFDMPLTMAKGSASSTFTYGADHQRTKQARSDGVTFLYGGAMEVESGSGGDTVKTYWPMGLGVEIDRPNATETELNWTHVDRLGSVVLITDKTGAIPEGGKLAYDVWGKRRALNGQDTSDTIDGKVDNKGFTGHEMLDQLDLVHMNGRVYDPRIARFMSPDPIIQDPEHSQSYNRYTYVWNNPTNLTDPTGFEGEAAAPPPKVEPECDKRCRQIQDDLRRERCRLLGCLSSEKGRTNSSDDTAKQGQRSSSGGIGDWLLEKIQHGGQRIKNAVRSGAFWTDEERDNWGFGLVEATEAGNSAEFIRQHPFGTAITDVAYLAAGGIAPLGEVKMGKLATDGGLAIQETIGGHVIAKHVAQSDAQLLSRLAQESLIPAASTFASRAEAEALIGKTLDANTKQIIAWVNGGAKGKKAFDAAVAGGRVMLRGATSAIEGSVTRVVLIGNGTGGFRILTGFPLK